jgi:hypothetical protein
MEVRWQYVHKIVKELAHTEDIRKCIQTLRMQAYSTVISILLSDRSQMC